MAVGVGVDVEAGQLQLPLHSVLAFDTHVASQVFAQQAESDAHTQAAQVSAGNSHEGRLGPCAEQQSPFAGVTVVAGVGLGVRPSPGLGVAGGFAPSNGRRRQSSSPVFSLPGFSSRRGKKSVLPTMTGSPAKPVVPELPSAPTRKSRTRTVPSDVPSDSQISRPREPSDASKNTRPAIDERSLGELSPVSGAMSAIWRVPAWVPSERQSSKPVAGVKARK